MTTTYVVNFNSKRIPGALSNGSRILRNSNGDEDVISQFRDKPMPNTRTTIAVRKEFPSNKPIIDISQDTLDKIVPYFNFIDDVKQERIESAKIDFGIDTFWNHPELTLEIDNAGYELKVNSHNPTEYPIDTFWLAVMKADPSFFIDDGSNRRPETMADVQFIVKPKRIEEVVLKKEISSLIDAKETFRSILSMSRNKKMFIIDNLGDNLYDPKNTSDKDLEDIILMNLDKNRERRIDNGMKFGDFVEDIVKKNDDFFSISQNVKYALSKSIIEKSGDMYYFEKMACGNTIKEVEEYFAKPENNKRLISLDLIVNKQKSK